MTNVTLRIFLVLSTISACSPAAMGLESLRTAVVVFRVFPVFDSEGSRRVARSELGCDPCREITFEEPDGTDAQFFLNPDAGVRLDARLVTDVGLDSGDEGAIVFVNLTDQGRSAIESLASSRADFAANFVEDKLIGVVPLRMFESRYVIALPRDASAAEKIVRLLDPSRD